MAQDRKREILLWQSRDLPCYQHQATIGRLHEWWQLGILICMICHCLHHSRITLSCNLAVYNCKEVCHQQRISWIGTWPVWFYYQISNKSIQSGSSIAICGVASPIATTKMVWTIQRSSTLVIAWSHAFKPIKTSSDVSSKALTCPKGEYDSLFTLHQWLKSSLARLCASSEGHFCSITRKNIFWHHTVNCTKYWAFST